MILNIIFGYIILKYGNRMFTFTPDIFSGKELPKETI